MFSSLARTASRSALIGQRRHLNVHEFVAKQIMKEHNIDHQRGLVVEKVEDIIPATKQLPTKWYIVKSQILAGGRGKGTFDTGFKGGVKLAKNAEAARDYGKEMLGNKLVTHQTGPAGQKVSKLFIAECLDIQKEYYFAILFERKAGGPVLLGSSQGGVDIETVAKESPEALVTQPVDINKGLSLAEATSFAQKMGFQGGFVAKAADIMVKLYDVMIKTDATMIEINPFVETPDGRVVCIDGKFNFDDSAQFRQKAIFAQRDITQEDDKEVAAEKHGLNYISLDGNIACLVNGAGLAMATMDIIQMHGGRPANFLDVGGGATKEAVTAAFNIILSDSNVQGILVNIFGGIMRCDVIAQGITAAAKTVGLKVPLVVRLAGTNQELGAKILSESGLAIIPATDLDDAAKKIVGACAKK